MALGKLFYLPIAVASSELAMESVSHCGASTGVSVEG